MKRFLFTFLVISLVFIGLSQIQAQTKNTDNKKGDKSSIALSDEQAMITAMEICYIDINYYVSLENLNDIVNSTASKPFDDINQLGGTPVIDLATGLFKPVFVDLTKLPTIWLGPYATYQDSKISETGGGYDPGTPIDPWGRPYYFFSPMGLIRPTTQSVTLELYADEFDRYAIVSLGPDGVKSADDIISKFGAPPTQMMISSTSKAAAARGEVLIINGYNFGIGTRKNLGSVKYVLLNEKQIPEVLSWDNRAITIRIPNDAESGTLKVVNGAQISNEFNLTINETAASARVSWEMYN